MANNSINDNNIDVTINCLLFIMILFSYFVGITIEEFLKS